MSNKKRGKIMSNQYEVMLGKIKPSRFRDFSINPFKPRKLATLTKSIESTGFWGGLVVRESDGYFELAFGHHRHKALLDMFGPRKVISVTVEEIDDFTMLQMMAFENSTDFEQSIGSVIEVVRQAVLNIGKSVHPKVKKGSKTSPSFVDDKVYKRMSKIGVETSEHIGISESEPVHYSLQCIAEMVGYVSHGGHLDVVCKKSFQALALEELGYLEIKNDFNEITEKKPNGDIIVKHEGLNLSGAYAVIATAQTRFDEYLDDVESANLAAKKIEQEAKDDKRKAKLAEKAKEALDKKSAEAKEASIKAARKVAKDLKDKTTTTDRVQKENTARQAKAKGETDFKGLIKDAIKTLPKLKTIKTTARVSAVIDLAKNEPGNHRKELEALADELSSLVSYYESLRDEVIKLLKM